MNLARENKPNPKFIVQEIAKKYGVEILILPVAHPELNPIEMVWSEIKRKCAQKNLNFKLKEVEQIARQEMANMTAEKFAAYESHSIARENEYEEFLLAE